MQAGVDGYVLKKEIGAELLEAIRSLYSGKRFFSHKLASVTGPADLEDDQDP